MITADTIGNIDYYENDKERKVNKMNLLDFLWNMEALKEEGKLSEPAFWPEGTTWIRYDYPFEFLAYYPCFWAGLMDIETLAEKSNTAVSVVKELIHCLELELKFEGVRKYFILDD